MNAVKITRLRDSGLALPSYETDGAAGMDLCADIADGSFTLKPMQRQLVPTGIAIEIPNGFEMQIRPRSGLAIKHGVTTLNAPGTIDSDYRGEIGVILINLGDTEYTVAHGARIAQMVMAPVTRCIWQETVTLSPTRRGVSGFGSTGV